MNNKTLATLFTVLCSFLFANTFAQQTHINVIPQPNNIIQGKDHFIINPKTVITCSSEQISKNVSILSSSLKENTGLELKTKKNAGAKNSIHLKLNPVLKPEAYHITIDKKGIVCEASSNVGMFYAVQTLLQSIKPTDGKYAINCMIIEDSPQYQWRGFMLDDSRHFFGKEVVKQILDVMAYLKMNRFHMHLTDENGWRVEIKKYPKLTEIGAEGNWSDRNAPRKFYTQDDIREIIAYAAERHIMVIPEIDMPGHASAASRAYPEISGGGTGRWEGFTFHPAKETTYQFIDDVMTEIATLFPAPYIHIGGDEVHYGNKVWFTDPLIQQFIKDNNLKNEIGLEHYFVRRACDIVNSKGKTMIGWDEIIASGVTPDKAITMWWRHDKPKQLTTALNKGFSIIMTPRIPCYFDFVQDSTQQIGRRWGGKFNPINEVYTFPDDINSLIKNNQSQIMGMQASTWTERIADTKRLYYMIFPRLAAIAEDAWTNQTRKDYSSFENNIPDFLKYLDKKGINYFNPFDKKTTPEPWGPTKADVIAEG